MDTPGEPVPEDPDRDGLSDDDLLMRARDGDAPAFEAFYDRHAPAVFSLAHWLMGSHATAQDLVRDAFLAVWHGGQRLDDAHGDVRGGMLRTVRRLGLERLGPEAMAARWGDEISAARPGLERLPAELSAVVGLAHLGGATAHEIAGLLGISPGVARRRLRQGLDLLRAPDV